MNGLSGFDHVQVLSVFLMAFTFIVFTVIAAAALWRLFVDSEQKDGVVPPTAFWHIGAGFWSFWSFVALVWAAPAEQAYTGPGGVGFLPFNEFSLGYTQWLLYHFDKMFSAWVFAILAVICLALGWVTTRRFWQKRARRAASNEPVKGATLRPEAG